jgi:hypothetical protein
MMPIQILRRRRRRGRTCKFVQIGTGINRPLTGGFFELSIHFPQIGRCRCHTALGGSCHHRGMRRMTGRNGKCTPFGHTPHRNNAGPRCHTPTCHGSMIETIGTVPTTNFRSDGICIVLECIRSVVFSRKLNTGTTRCCCCRCRC